MNTDGFSIGAEKETYVNMRIFEIAKGSKSMRHYVFSGLDYATKKGGYNPDYSVDHFNGKGRVSDWLKAQPSVVSHSDMSWTVVTSGVYMEMLNNVSGTQPYHTLANNGLVSVHVRAIDQASRRHICFRIPRRGWARRHDHFTRYCILCTIFVRSPCRHISPEYGNCR